MQTRPLGRTGLTVTRMGLGLAALGRPAYINRGHAEDLGRDYDVAAMRRHAHDVLDAAWDAGIRYLDAARSYGRAEEFLRAWLDGRNITPAALTVGSKWGYTYTAGWRLDADEHEVKDHSVAALLRQTAETMELLGGHLDLYQVHSATLDSGALDDADLHDRLARLRNEGTAIGLTVSGPEQSQALDRALGIERDGRLLFQTVQATWNLLEPSVGGALERARDAGLGVIVKEVVANGRLTARGDLADHPVASALVERHAVGLDALAIAAALARPDVDVVLSGATTTEQLEANLQALEVRWMPHDEDAVQVLVESPSEYWRTRGELPWN